MPTDLRQLPAYLSTDADFRTWTSGISAQLLTTGMVKTTDTGQIDHVTVVRPTISTYAGYEIWRFADSLQATKPVFLKVEYGLSSATDRSSLRVSVGTSTNGAGVLGGQLSSVRSMTYSTSKTVGITLPSYCSGSTNRLNLCTNLDVGNSGFAFVLLLERTKTAAGAVTGDGIIFFTQFGSTGAFQTIPFAGTIPANANQNNAMPLTTGSISSVSLDVALSPTMAFLGKPLFAFWCAYVHADIGELATFTMNHLGAVHTFLPLGDGVGNVVVVSGTSGHSLAMLWE